VSSGPGVIARDEARSVLMVVSPSTTSAPPAAQGASPGGDALTTGMPRRKLGRTEVMVSMLGLGGFHLGQGSLSDAEAIRIVLA